jgi:hypothetical protein
MYGCAIENNFLLVALIEREFLNMACILQRVDRPGLALFILVLFVSTFNINVCTNP